MGSRFKANFYIVELTIFTCTQSPYHQHSNFFVCVRTSLSLCLSRHRHHRHHGLPVAFITLPSALIPLSETFAAYTCDVCLLCFIPIYCSFFLYFCDFLLFFSWKEAQKCAHTFHFNCCMNLIECRS